MNKITEQGMLTKTYTSLALSHEQANARQLLSKLNACVQQAQQDIPEAKRAAAVKTAAQKFLDADRYYRARAIEKYVVPSIGERIPQARPVLDELASLSDCATQAVQHMQEQMHSEQARFARGTQSALSAMEQYCRHMQARLNKEEGELIPLAFRSLTPEEWFAIAIQCLPEKDACGKKAA